MTLLDVKNEFWGNYSTKTPKDLKIVDSFLVYILLTGVIQFVYCCLMGTFPYNAFLSGFICSVGSFVLMVCLRMQIDPANRELFKDTSRERAFADFVFCNLIMHFICINFIG